MPDQNTDSQPLSPPNPSPEGAESAPLVPSAAHLRSVGRVATETGISAHTLRVWERRYQNPMPVRLPSGHRRYTTDQIRFLRKVAEGLSLGFRPGRLLRCAEDELEALLATRNSQREELTPETRGWIAHLRQLDASALGADLRASAHRHGPLQFLETRVSPFLREVGRLWANGDMEVRHEHMASQVLEDVLRDMRTQIENDVPATNGKLLLATLSEERHGLGILMVSIIAALHGISSSTLGIDTPISEVVRAVDEAGADAVGISVSSSTAAADSLKAITELRAALSERTLLVLGGEGIRRVRRKLPGAAYFVNLGDFDRWLDEGKFREMLRTVS